MVQHCIEFKEDPSQFSMGKTAQSLPCSIMEKPHTGFDECPRTQLSCFRARNSAPSRSPLSPFLQFLKAEIVCQGRKSAANANLRSVDFSQGGNLARATSNEEGGLKSAGKIRISSVG